MQNTSDGKNEEENKRFHQETVDSNEQLSPSRRTGSSHLRVSVRSSGLDHNSFQGKTLVKHLVFVP